MTYQLVAVDLDGTLIGPDLQVQPRDREAIGRARAAGVRITIATGRGFPVTQEYARDLGLATPVICYQGGLVKDPATGEVLYEATLPSEAYAEAVQLAQEQDLDFHVYAGNIAYLTELRRSRAFYDRWFSLPFRQVHDLVTELDHPPVKFLITADEDEADQIEKVWKAHFDGRLQIVRSHPLFVEGTSLGVSKGNALAHLAEHLGIAQEAVIAIGDNDNDRSMIQWAGLGVVVGNAPDSLKADADYVAPVQSEAAVAHVIQRFILGS
ncbi:MAG: Cof-type HAD-IIB family hydrolase [Anaerolineae bacterium]